MKNSYVIIIIIVFAYIIRDKLENIGKYVSPTHPNLGLIILGVFSLFLLFFLIEKLWGK